MKFRHFLLALFSVVIITSCDNEDVDDLSQVTTAQLIAEESELFDLLNQVASDDGDQEELTCIEFIYAFTVITYDENLEIINSAVVETDGEFYDYLQGVGENEYINVSFPITSMNEEGDIFEVNNKEELATAIADCKDVIEDQVIGECTELLLKCVWEVDIPETTIFSTYKDAVFDVNKDGTVNFFHRGEVYEGTWIVYFIEDELHININLANDEEIGLDWNFDWKTTIVDAEQMDLVNDDGDSFIFRQECDAANYCTTLEFVVCEDQDNEGFATINPNDYTDCVIVMAAPQQEYNEETMELSDPIDWVITYHLDIETAEMGTAPIDEALTIENDGFGIVVFARILNPDTEEFTIAEVTLLASVCEI